MGGYGALRFAFSHPEMFSAVSAQSAALITESPRELDLAARPGAPLGKVLADVFGDPIHVSHWNADDPFLLARKNAAALKKLAIYFNCGQDDNYGFEKGAAALHDELEKLGVKTSTISTPATTASLIFWPTSPRRWNFTPTPSALFTSLADLTRAICAAKMVECKLDLQPAERWPSG